MSKRNGPPETPRLAHNNEPPKVSCWKKHCQYLYDKDKKLFCGRTCVSWFIIILYSMMYIIFLSTFTMIFMYIAFLILNKTRGFEISHKTDLDVYSENGIGLTATPTSVNSQPLISYGNESESYDKYVKSIQNLLGRRRKSDADTNLGQCGQNPYGYGDKPCVIVRINKQLKWSARPLSLNSSNATKIPNIVWNWMKLDKRKLWLVCSGYNSYDKEHIRSIRYYPYPPGFDAALYPLNMDDDPPLIAVQMNHFTFGLSLTIECKLWYEGGVSATAFLLYVADNKAQIFRL